MFDFVQIKTSIARFLRSLPCWFRDHYQWQFLLLPFLCVVMVYQLGSSDVWVWAQAGPLKVRLEIFHPTVLAVGMVLALLSGYFFRQPTLTFLGFLAGFAFARELGGQGTSILLYIGLVGLIVYADLHPEKLIPLLGSRLVMSLVATAFICYALSQMFDRGIIKRLGWLFVWGTAWKPPFSSQIEESLEALGGLCLLAAIVFLLMKVGAESLGYLNRSSIDARRWFR